MSCETCNGTGEVTLLRTLADCPDCGTRRILEVVGAPRSWLFWPLGFKIEFDFKPEGMYIVEEPDSNYVFVFSGERLVAWLIHHRADELWSDEHVRPASDPPMLEENIKLEGSAWDIGEDTHLHVGCSFLSFRDGGLQLGGDWDGVLDAHDDVRRGFVAWKSRPVTGIGLFDPIYVTPHFGTHDAFEAR